MASSISGSGESGEGLSQKAKRTQALGVPLLVLSDEPTAHSPSQQGTPSCDVRKGQLQPQKDKSSPEEVLEAMITDSPMVSPVQSIKPSPVRKKTPAQGAQSAGKVRAMRASSGPNDVKTGQSSSTSDVIDLTGAVNIVKISDIEQQMEVDEVMDDPNVYRSPHRESVSDGEPPEQDSNDEDDDDDPELRYGFVQRSHVVPGSPKYLQNLSESLNGAIQYQTDKNGDRIVPWATTESEDPSGWVPRFKPSTCFVSRAAHKKVVENKNMMGLDALPELRANVSIPAKDLPYTKMGSQQMTALATAWIQADFQCPIAGCNSDIMEIQEGVETGKKLRVAPSARVSSPRVPRDELGNTYGVGIWAGSGTFSMRVDVMMKHWAGLHMARGHCIVCPCPLVDDTHQCDTFAIT